MSLLSPRRSGARRALPGMAAVALVLPLLVGGGSVAVATLPATLPTAGLEPALDEPNGLRAEYYTMSAPGALDFGELQSTIADAAINFPSFVGTLQAQTGQSEHVSVRWTGEIEPEFSEDYTFSAIGDNGFRVWVDGQLLIDHWVNDWDIEQTAVAPIALEAGQRYDLTVEYFQATGGANMFLRWASPSQEKETIPTEAYYPPEGFDIFPAEGVVAENGTDVTVSFAGAVAGTEGLAEHLEMLVDGYPWPVQDLRAEGSTLTFSTEEIDRESQVRVNYTGGGALTVGGAAVPELSVLVTNNSTDTLRTQWGDDLDVDDVLPEYPRPQLVREQWQNLNGVWEFAEAGATEAPTFGEALEDEIVVPFAVESELSGIERNVQHMFYRRLVTVPEGWDVGGEDRLRLNFGAVDYDATVWVNGTQVGTHEGGYDAFSLDITDALEGSGEQEIVVGVHDTTNGTQQAVGKQTLNPGGIFYTPTSGIWQTVWMEPVPAASIEEVVLTPDLEGGEVDVVVAATGASDGARAEVVVTDAAGVEAGRVTGALGADLSVPVADMHLWTPDDPYLYDVTVTLTDGEAQDVVESYTAMRSIEVAQVDGVNRILLNGEQTYLLSTLDQGYWPDGQYTPASDEAYVFDLQAHKDLGFNTVRKHIKVEAARWYYHADRLGLMVWQDIPSGWFNDQGATPEARTEWVDQAHEIMDQLRSVPSVVGWVVFNEGWGEWDLNATRTIVEELEAYDPTRLMNGHSGVNCCASKGDSGAGDIIDWHQYTGPALPRPDATRAAIDGEHGGFSLSTPGHMWPGASANPYGDVGSQEALTDAYVQNTATLVAPARCYLSGSIYTQISDVENEVNGFFTYDRRVLKMDEDRVREINEEVLAAGSAGGQEYGPGTPGLAGVGAWSLDEGTGTASQDSAGDHDMTLQGGAGWADGHDGSALHLSGDAQWAQTSEPVVDTTGNYSVSAWVQLDRIPGPWATVVGQDAVTGSSAFYLQYGFGQFAFSFPNTRATVAITPEVGTWYHLVGVRDAEAQTLTLYLDGREVGQAQICGGDESDGPLTIGRGLWQGQPVDFWPGTIDEVRAFDRALSAEEVGTLFAGAPADTTAPTVSAAVDAEARTVTLTATDDSPGDVAVEYRLGTSGEWLAYSGPVAVGDGAVTVQYRATDVADNVSPVGSVDVPAAEPQEPQSPTFVDVAPGHAFYPDIRWLADNGLSEGTAAGGQVFFYPGSAMSRQAMAAFLYRYADTDWTPAAGTRTFTDVSPEHQFYVQIEWLAETGIGEGYEDGTFGPTNPVSRQATAAFLHRLAGEPEAVGPWTFTDVTVDHEFADAIAWLRSATITEGYADGSFGPTRPVTRQAMAAFLHRYDQFLVRAAAAPQR